MYIPPQIKDRLLSLEGIDEAGGKVDEVTITLDDQDSELELTLPGAPLAVAMGYEDTVLLPIASYTEGEVVAKGPPDTIVIRGKAANLGWSINEQKTRAWGSKTLEQIVADIAGEHMLTAEMQILAIGLRVGVSGTWAIKSPRHALFCSGFTTQTETEKPKKLIGLDG